MIIVIMIMKILSTTTTAIDINNIKKQNELHHYCQYE